MSDVRSELKGFELVTGMRSENEKDRKKAEKKIKNTLTKIRNRDIMYKLIRAAKPQGTALNLENDTDTE